MRDAALLLATLLLLGGVLLVLMYLRYRHSPVVLWRARVLRRRAEVHARRGVKKDRAGQAAVDEAVSRLDRLAEIARDVSFWNSLFHQKVPGLTDEVLHAELPDVLPRASRDQGGAPSSRPSGVEDVAAPKGRGEQTKPVDLPFLPRLRAVCRYGLLVAKADGRVAKAESAVLRAHLGQVFASDPVALRFLDVEMEQAGKGPLNEADVIAGVMAFSPGERRELLALAHRIATAAGQIGAKEQQLLARLHAALAVPDAALPPPPAADPRAVLDIPPGAELSPELIRRRFAMLSDKADPAKAAELGAEFAAMAERKRAELKAAAETLLAPFGVPLEPPPPPPPPADLRHNPALDAVFGV